MELSHALKLVDYLTIVALLLGPVLAVGITLWHQERHQKYTARERLFIQLMSHRKSFPPTREWAQGLNLIDVLYAKHPKVVKAWHDLFDYAHIRPMDNNEFERKNLILMSQMAESLGYKTLQQADINRFYSPEMHGNQAVKHAEMENELLRVLKNTQSLSATQKQS